MEGTQCELLEPTDKNSVIKLIAKLGTEAKLIAGGTDLLIDVRNGIISPKYLISLSNVRGLREIKTGKKNIEIGSMTTANDLAENKNIKKHLPALSDAAFSMASYQIRNMATIGGNLCSAVPSADLAPPLIAAEAKIVLMGPNGERTVPLNAFFLGPRKTAMSQDEFALKISVPLPGKGTGISYKKFKNREANALATAASAARLTIVGDLIIQASIVLGAVGPTPIIANEAVDHVRGKKPTKALFTEAGKLAYTQCRPITDVRCCADVRREHISVLTRRALEEAYLRAGGRL
jgi:CO/xanthine dehydrogenase FAD-binding subunit